MIDWNKVDKMERKTDHNIYERRLIAPSVQEQLNKFDKLACEGNPTEEDFHQNNEKTVVCQERNYIQKALRKTLRWHAFCQTST